MTKITFEDLPSTNTPLSANNLNTMQDNIENAIPVLDSVISTSSTNGVQNGTITTYVNTKTDLTTISGYNSSNTQILKNVNGTLKWIDE